MALFLCPECGKMISSQVKVCPFCQSPIETNAPSVASPSTYSARAGSSAISKPAETPSPYYNMPTTVTRSQGSKGKVIAIILGAVVLVAALAGGAYLFMNNQNSPEKILASAQAAYDKKNYTETMTILKTLELEKNAPAEKLYVDTITAQANQLATAGDYDAAFECLDDSGYRDDESIAPLYTQLRYEALVIQFIPELLANVPSPDAIDLKEIRLYSSEKYAESQYEGRIYPICFFVLKGQSEGDELSYWQFSMDEKDSHKISFVDSLTESQFNGSSGGDDLLISIRAGLMGLYLDPDGAVPLIVIDGARIMGLIENNSYKNISMPNLKDIEAFS